MEPLGAHAVSVHEFLKRQIQDQADLLRPPHPRLLRPSDSTFARLKVGRALPARKMRA